MTMVSDALNVFAVFVHQVERREVVLSCSDKSDIFAIRGPPGHGVEVFASR